MATYEPQQLESVAIALKFNLGSLRFNGKLKGVSPPEGSAIANSLVVLIIGKLN